jgi:hypothetical protein
VINVVTEMVAVMTAVVVAMREESKEGINQAKIGTVLNAEIAIFHSVKTVTAVKHLDQVLAVQALAVMKDMVDVTKEEAVMTVVVVMTAEVVMIEEVVMTAETVILIVLQAEMALITVMTGNVQSAKIIISLSAQNVIAAV